MRFVELILASVMLCACSADTFSGNDAGEDAASDASADHKLGVSNDASSDSPFGSNDAGVSVSTCEVQDGDGPPTSCNGAVNNNDEPLPVRYWCPRDSGMHPFGTIGVDCSDEGDYQNITEWCCKS